MGWNLSTNGVKPQYKQKKSRFFLLCKRRYILMVACGVFKKQYKIAPKIVAMFPASMLWPIQDMGTVCRQPHHPAAASPNGYRFVQCTNVHGNNCSFLNIIGGIQGVPCELYARRFGCGRLVRAIWDSLRAAPASQSPLSVYAACHTANSGACRRLNKWRRLSCLLRTRRAALRRTREIMT